jgi:hypothetical protein
VLTSLEDESHWSVLQPFEERKRWGGEEEMVEQVKEEKQNAPTFIA